MYSTVEVEPQFLSDVIVFHVRERRIYGEPDNQFDITIPYSETYKIPSLPDNYSGELIVHWCPQRWEKLAFGVSVSNFESAFVGADEEVVGPYIITDHEYGERPSKELLHPEDADKLRLHLVNVHAEIREQLLRKRIKLYELSDRSFEEFVASIFNNQGLKVEFTKITEGDPAGRHIIAVNSNPITDIRLIIECRRQNPNDHVSFLVVRELWDIMADPSGRFHQGIIATSSYFSEDARKDLATFWQIEGKDHDDLMKFADFFEGKNGIWQPNPFAARIKKPKGLSETKCFISYSRKNTETAKRLAVSLREAGANTWLDQENIPSGAKWDIEIQNAITQCTHLIVVITNDSVQSDPVQDEINFAMNKNKMVIPIIFEECELPLRLQRLQWVDLRGNFEEGIQKLILDLNSI